MTLEAVRVSFADLATPRQRLVECDQHADREERRTLDLSRGIVPYLATPDPPASSVASPAPETGGTVAAAAASADLEAAKTRIGPGQRTWRGWCAKSSTSVARGQARRPARKPTP